MLYFLQRLEYRNPDQFGGNVRCGYALHGHVVRHDHGRVLRGRVLHGRVLHGCVLHGRVLHGRVLRGLHHDHALHDIRVVLDKEFHRLHKIQGKNLEIKNKYIILFF